VCTAAKGLLESPTIKRLSKDKPIMAPAAVMCPFNAATVGIPSVKIPQGSTGGKAGHSQVSKLLPSGNQTWQLKVIYIIYTVDGGLVGKSSINKRSCFSLPYFIAVSGV
jgi:hypothetical protein